MNLGNFSNEFKPLNRHCTQSIGKQTMYLFQGYTEYPNAINLRGLSSKRCAYSQKETVYSFNTKSKEPPDVKL